MKNNYEKIWQKTLNQSEKVEHEFSISNKFIWFNFIWWSLVSFFILIFSKIGITMFLLSLFYFHYYLKRANAYAFTNKRVLIHRGLFSTHMISIEYPKITDITVQEPFFDRTLAGSGNLSINTAGTNTKEVVLKHISNPYELKKKLDALMN